jgi:hypothetical protein
VALEIEQVHPGVMIALPPGAGAIFRDLTAAGLKQIAAQMDLGYDRRSKRGPKKPPPAMDQYRNGGQVSTHKRVTKRIRDLGSSAPEG